MATACMFVGIRPSQPTSLKYCADTQHLKNSAKQISSYEKDGSVRGDPDGNKIEIQDTGGT